MIQTSVAVAALDHTQRSRAAALAARLELPLLESPHPAHPYHYLLVVTPDYVGLQAAADKKFAPFYINFLSEKLVYRRNQAGLRKEMLARAMGCKPIDQPRIIDATAGLGRDSFILAALGFNVVLIERSPIIHALLQDALKRAARETDYLPIVQRMTLIHADARPWLLAQSILPDIIYLDPCSPPVKSQRLSKKKC